jgi:D-alanine--poly(phosphoribitol) ligase subunit 1
LLVHQAFSRHAASQPDNAALIHRADSISYGLLEAASNTYAAELTELGAGRGQVVPVVFPRGPQLVAIQLGILKCGAAYAGIDPRWPVSRISAILQQVSPAVAVSHAAIGQCRFRIYQPRAESVAGAAARGLAFEPPELSPSAPATVFFTSGTTGTPKGVVSPHQAVTRLFRPGGLGGFGPGHVTPQAAPLAWDMYAFELWGQLTTGGTTALVDGDHLLPRTLRHLIQTAGVDTLWLTTSLFNLFLDEDPDCFQRLRQVITGGEKVSPHHMRLFLERYPAIPLWNAYGPAENCMITTIHRVQPDDCDTAGGVPVGRPVPGTRVVILDAAGRPCRAGQPGEICIAGLGLATGYLGDPGLTQEKFRTVSVDGEPARIYRTGDIGILDRSGVLHFRGRQDRQVKISGHRVEMAEIEITARGLPGIRECAALPVTAPDGRVSRLALFYVSEPTETGRQDGHGAGSRAVRDQLSRLLPSYLVPAIVRELTRFPVTANGKLDRAELLRLARQPAPSRPAAARVQRRRSR